MGAEEATVTLRGVRLEDALRSTKGCLPEAIPSGFREPSRVLAWANRPGRMVLVERSPGQLDCVYALCNSDEADVWFAETVTFIAEVSGASMEVRDAVSVVSTSSPIETIVGAIRNKRRWWVADFGDERAPLTPQQAWTLVSKPR